MPIAIFLPSASVSAMYLADWGNGVGVAAGLDWDEEFGGDAVGDEPLEQADRAASAKSARTPTIRVRRRFFMRPACLRPLPRRMKIAWRLAGDRLAVVVRQRQSARKVANSSRKTCQAGSVSVNRWLLLPSDTSRESGMSAASSSP